MKGYCSATSIFILLLCSTALMQPLMAQPEHTVPDSSKVGPPPPPYSGRASIYEIGPDPERLFRSGVEAFNLGRDELSLGLLQQCLTVNPNHAGAWNYVGAIRERQGRFNEALQNYRLAVHHLCPGSPNFADLDASILRVGALCPSPSLPSKQCCRNFSLCATACNPGDCKACDHDRVSLFGPVKYYQPYPGATPIAQRPILNQIGRSKAFVTLDRQIPNNRYTHWLCPVCNWLESQP